MKTIIIINYKKVGLLNNNFQKTHKFRMKTEQLLSKHLV